MGVRSLDIQGFERGYVGKIDAMNSELKLSVFLKLVDHEIVGKIDAMNSELKPFLV